MLKCIKLLVEVLKQYDFRSPVSFHVWYHWIDTPRIGGSPTTKCEVVPTGSDPRTSDSVLPICILLWGLVP